MMAYLLVFYIIFGKAVLFLDSCYSKKLRFFGRHRVHLQRVCRTVVVSLLVNVHSRSVNLYCLQFCRQTIL